MHTLPPLVLAAGAEAASAAQVRDTAEATRDAVAGALERSEIVIVSGGVSVGEHDHVRPAFAELGVEQVFWGVSLRPGKPTYFGVGAERHPGLRPARQPGLGDRHLPALRPPGDPPHAGRPR